MRSLRSRRNRRWRRAAGERPTDPRLFAEWSQVLRPAASADPVLVERVRVAIDRLPAKQRDVINGLFFEGITKTTLAARMKLNRHEIRRLMIVGFAALEKALK